MAAPAKAMRAVVYDASKQMNMRWETAFPVPVPGPKQVVVKTHVVAINPIDYKLPTLPIVGHFVKGKARNYVTDSLHITYLTLLLSINVYIFIIIIFVDIYLNWKKMS